MTIKHTASQEFGIPREQLLKPISGDLLVGLGGFTGECRNMTPQQIALSLVMVEGYSYGGGRSWTISARSAHAGDEAEPVFGSASIEDDSGRPITPEQALHEGANWIRSSSSTEFVPGNVYPLPVPDEMKNIAVAGLILVRAAEAQ